MIGGHKTEVRLRRVGEAPDEEMDLAESALLLASVDRPGVALNRYRDHIASMAKALSKIAAEQDGLDQRIDSLNEVIFETYGYEGDRRTYDDLQNANLIRVIDRRRGLPVALGILMIATARAQGWEIAGLCFPGHFLLRMEHQGQRAILDPFEAGERKSAADLRKLIRTQEGEEAGLNPGHYEAVSDREVLVTIWRRRRRSKRCC
jgi:regulator of sirC expression with transglutaminase-like and TPR domain